MNKKILIAILAIFIIISIVVVVILSNKENESLNKNSSNNINVSNTNENETTSNIGNSDRNPENVTIEVDDTTISPKSVSITITDNNEEHYGWGVEFRVQQKVNGEWKDLEYVSNDLAWIDIAYVLNADNQLTQKLDIEKYYGSLNKGTYRIVKPVYDNKYIDIYSNEFEIR